MLWLVAAALLAVGVTPAGCASRDPADSERVGTNRARVISVGSPVSLVAQNSNKCVGFSGGLAVQATCTGATWQQWTLKPVADGYQIVSLVDPSKCMNIPGASATKSTTVAVTTCSTTGVPGEIWAAQAVGGNFNLVATHDQLCMDVYGQSTADGANIDQYTCVGTANQLWAIQPAAPEADAAVPALPVSLVAQNSGKCVGVSVGVAVQETCTGANSQQWLFNPVAGGYQVVSALDPTNCLNVPNASTARSTAIAVSTCSTTGVPGEIWAMNAVGNNFNLVATHDQLCLDVYGQSTNSGAELDQYTCVGTTNQLWAIRPAAPAAATRVSLVAQNSGKCVDISGGWATQETCTGTASQQWMFDPVAGGYQIVSALDPTNCLNVPNASTARSTAIAVSTCSTTGVPGEIWAMNAVGSNFNLVATHDQLCLDVYGQSTNSGAELDQYTCVGTTNQLWALQPAAEADASVDGSLGGGADATISGGGSPDAGNPSGWTNVLLVARNSGKCVGVWGAAAAQQTCIGTYSEQWTFRPVAGGYQVVSTLDPTKCLNVPGASTALSTALAVSTCSTHGVPGEIWAPRAVGGDFNLVALHDELCLDVSGDSVADGAPMDQYTCVGTTNQLFTIQAVAPRDPTSAGQWSTLLDLPSIPVAAAMLPSGKILTWASWEPDNFGGAGLPRTYTNMIDPQTLSATSTVVTQTNHDMFCPGTAMLPDGRVFINGGGLDVANTSLYDSLAGTWATDALMNQVRWYNVSVTLPDGTVFTLGGNRLSGLSGTGEHWTPGGGWQTIAGAVMTPLLTTDTTNRSQEHPRLFVAPNGKIFVPGPTPEMQWYDLSGGGTITSAGLRGDDVFSQNDVTVMFDIGKLLKAGGNTNYGQTYASTTPSSSNAYVIDINGGVGPAAVMKVAPLAHARAYANGVILPDGHVLVVGGLDNGQAFTDTGAVLTPELFDPTTATWRDLAPMDVPRTYHSVALLMPDARVFVGGGGLCGTGCAANHPDAQIYSPPYLFQGSRPTITSAPGSASYGSALKVSTAGTVTGFAWVRMSSVTHTVNTDQRWLSAPSTSTGSGTYSVAAPSNANVAPPGYYMLFALDGSIPSVSQIVRMGP